MTRFEMVGSLATFLSQQAMAQASNSVRYLEISASVVDGVTYWQ
jgi:hypothetical protein